MKKEQCPNIIINNKIISSFIQIKYLGLTLDKCLTWQPYLNIKRQAANTIFYKLRPLLKLKININTKLLIYNSIIR